jgi:hypothetical protein
MEVATLSSWKGIGDRSLGARSGVACGFPIRRGVRSEMTAVIPSPMRGDLFVSRFARANVWILPDRVSAALARPGRWRRVAKS